MAKSKKDKELVDRRGFLKGATVGGIAALVSTTGALGAQQATKPPAGKAPVPLPEVDPILASTLITVDRPGADFMLDVLKSMGFEYAAGNPGQTWRGLHESIINYGGNKMPELITCCHEESAVGIAQGYADVEGKPMMAVVHTTVGLTHASMAIYNAWAGRSPVFLMVGNTLDSTVPHLRFHAAQDIASIVRDFTKWDDAPISLQQFADSAVRAYRVCMTPPREPIALVIDSEMQERGIPNGPRLRIPKLALDSPPQADSGAVAEIARLLVAAQNPVIIAGRVAHSQASMDAFTEFVEALQIPVIENVGGNVQGGNLPLRHPLNQTAARPLIQNADVILALEVENLWPLLNTNRGPMYRNGTKTISIGANDLYLKSNFEDLERYPEVDMAVAADPEITIPALSEAVKRLLTDDHKRMFQDRGKKFAEANQKVIDRDRADAVYGWNSSPLSRARISAEVWDQIKNEDWATATGGSVDSGLIGFDWDCDKYYRRSNNASANGIGFRAPTAVGSALAHKKHGRLFVYAQADGDLMFAPGVLWTAAHHRIPLLAVMHNNRAYHQEVMEIQNMAARHQRGIDRAGIGTKLEDPNIDFAKLAQGFGLYAENVTNANDLGPALKRAIAVVKKGEPALLDVYTQPR